MLFTILNNTCFFQICIKSNGPVVTYQTLGTAAEGEFIPPEIHQTVNRLEYTHNDMYVIYKFLFVFMCYFTFLIIYFMYFSHTIIALICVENFDQTHLVELPAVGAPNPKIVVSDL